MLANYLLIIPATAFILGIAYVIWHYRTGQNPPQKRGMLAWSIANVVLGVCFVAMAAFVDFSEPYKTILILLSPSNFWVAFVFYRRASAMK